MMERMVTMAVVTAVATAESDDSAFQKCEALNAQSFKTWEEMTEAGWSFSPDVEHIGNRGLNYMKQFDDGFRDTKCLTSQNSWFGYGSGGVVGKLSFTSPGDYAGSIDFGNCWKGGTVSVFIDDVKIKTAWVEEGSVVANFIIKTGQTLSIQERDADYAIARLNSLSLKCNGEDKDVQPEPFDQCAALSTNRYDKWADLARAGWTWNGQSTGAHYRTDMSREDIQEGTPGGVKCRSLEKSWFGWQSHTDVAHLDFVSPGTITGTIDFGNCGNSGYVNLYVNDKKVSSAGPETASVLAKLELKQGDVVSLRDEDGNAIMRLNGLDLHCPSADRDVDRLNECNAKNCRDWECSQWCTCFSEDDEQDYRDEGCGEDDQQSCDC